MIGFSCEADLANLVNMAAVKAAVDGSDKICSIQLEFAKDKILMGTERKSLTLSQESRKVRIPPSAFMVETLLDRRPASECQFG